MKFWNEEADTLLKYMVANNGVSWGFLRCYIKIESAFENT
jgi:hypothetical protein